MARCARRAAPVAHPAKRAALRPLLGRKHAAAAATWPAVEDLDSLCRAHTAPCTPLARLYPVPPNPCPQTPCKVVEYLRGLLDTAAATLSAAERSKVETAFLRAVDIELAFFDNAYASA